MKILVVLTFIATVQVFCDASERITLLTKKNFDNTIKENDFIIVDFYTPWCGPCKELEPEYERAAEVLAKNNPEIKFAKVNAEDESELDEQYVSRGYPTIIFFYKGIPIIYKGEQEAGDLVEWLIRKAGPPAKELSTGEDLKFFLSSAPVVVVGFFKDQQSTGAQQYLKTALDEAEIPFAITSNDTILLFKKFDNGRAVYGGELTKEAIKEFVETESRPLITDFNDDTYNFVFYGDKKTFLLIFLSKEAGHYDQYVEGLHNVAEEFKRQITFITIDIDNEELKDFCELFGMTKNKAPDLRIININDETMMKYKPERQNLDADNVRAFVQDYVDGKLEEHFSSQDLPDDWDKHPVKILVSSNFESVVLDTSKDVVVDFYTTWCEDCRNLDPIYEQLAEKFKSEDDIVISKINAELNENQYIRKIKSFPTIKLYAKGDNHVVECNRYSTLEELIEFVETRGSHAQATSSSSEDVIELTTEHGEIFEIDDENSLQETANDVLFGII